MPTYDYACDACGHEFEEFQPITAEPLRRCPACGRTKLRRLIGPGAGLIFKGSGFYSTDYRSEAYRKAAEAEKKAAGGDGAAKPEPQGQPKPAPPPEPDRKSKQAAGPESGATQARPRVRVGTSGKSRPRGEGRTKRSRRT